MKGPEIRAATFIIAALVAVILIASSNLWEPLELKAYDFRFKTIDHLGIGQDQPTGNIVIVGIEERDIDNKPLIFWYPDIGNFVLKMKGYGAKAVGLDIIPVHSLGEKLNSSIKAIIGHEISSQNNDFLSEVGEKADNSLLAPIHLASESTPIVQAVGGAIVPYYYGYMAYMKNVVPSSANLSVDDDSVLRTQKLRNEDNMDSVSYAFYKLLRGKEIQDDRIMLNYSLGRNIPYYPLRNVMDNFIGQTNFQGKAILLGFVSKSGVDTHFTPLGRNMSGVSIHAVAIETLLTKTYLKSVPFSISLLTLVTLTILGLLVSSKLRPIHAFYGTLLITIAFLLINTIAFSKGIILPMFPHILSPILMFGLIYPYRYLVEERYRQKIYKTFSYYVDRKVVDSMIERDHETLLKGEYKNICILLLDIRDFTRMSQKQKAEDIVKILNVYFGRVVNIIQHHDGFVNKFIGDGLLAFFASEESPVADAISASKEIVMETEKMNTEEIVTSIEGWRLNIGIGIHYGNVILGNIGSENKMDFTIIGSPVNIASRVEGLTKTLKKNVLITDDAYRMAGNATGLEPLGEFAVKGIEELIKVYTIKDTFV